MDNLTPVIYFLMACNQWVYTAGNKATYEYDNAIVYEDAYNGPHSNNNEDGSQYQSQRQRADYDDSDENGRFVFPDWRIKASRYLRKKQCMASCQPNPPYQPVCGSDGVTYHNLEQLECLMRCGVNINLRQLSPCGGRGTTARPAPATERTTLELNACTAQCPTTPEYNPVCGSDGVTYKNPGKLSCAQICGKDVQLHRRSPCPKLRATAEPTKTARAPRMYATCMATCVTAPEYRPVCGTNLETYFNMSRLQCAMRCGLDVSLLKSVACHIQENQNTIQR